MRLSLTFGGGSAEIMLSIKRLLDSEPATAVGAEDRYLRFALLLLQGISLHAVEADPAQYARFRDELERLGKRLEHNSEPAALPVLAGEAIQALEIHSRGVSDFVQERRSEYKAMVGMLARTVETFAGGCEKSVSQLQAIEKSLARAAALDDVRELRAQLSVCLDDLKSERERQQECAREILAAEQEAEETRESGGRPPDRKKAYLIDPCTGLPNREAASQAMDEALRSGDRWHAVLFVVDRVQLVNARFGYAVGDDLLLTFAQQLAQRLTPHDQCFRWNGPSLLALIRRAQPLHTVRLDIQRMLPGKIDRTFNVGSRSVLIPLSATWTVVPLFEIAAIEDAVCSLNAFLTSRAPGGAAAAI